MRQRLFYLPRGVLPKLPVECLPYVYIVWERRFVFFIDNQGLGHTISPHAPQISIISCVDDAYLFGHLGEALVTEHIRVWGYICEATAGAPFENRPYEFLSVSDVLRTMREWALPLQPAERHLLVAELEGVQFMGEEDPKFFIARISRLETTMRAVGIKKSESDIVQIILLQRLKRYDIVKIMTLADPQLTRSRLKTPSIPPTPNARPTKLRNNGRRWVRRRNHRTSMLLSSAVVFGTGGPWEAEANERTTVWYLVAVACLGSSRSYSNTGIAAVACFGSSSSCSNTGLAAVACRRRHSSSSSNTGLAVVACRGSSSNSSNSLAAVGFLISINVAPMFFLPPGRRDSSNCCSTRHGESLRSEVTGRAEIAPFLKLFSAVMAGLLRSGFSRTIWRCRCSPCRRDRSSRRRRHLHLLQQHLRLKR